MARPKTIRTFPELSFLVVAILVGPFLPIVAVAQPAPDRALSLESPLGGDLALTGFSGVEGVSRLFRFELDLVSASGEVDATDLVGQNVTFSVRRADGTPRLFNGFVSRFSAGDDDGEGRRTYRAEVVPWLWFLTKKTDCRIFQNRTVPGIVRQIVRETGLGELRLELSARYRRSECTVQYRESDFDFVSRLLERVGIAYYFDHGAGGHTLVLTDSPAEAASPAGCEVLPYLPEVDPTGPEPSRIMSWEHRYEYTSGRVTQTDYNFTAPRASLLTTVATVVDLPGNDRLELYEYPGNYSRISVGEELTRLRMEEEEARHDVAAGTANCRGLSPGRRFSISGHPSSRENGSYLITSVQHTAREPASYDPEGGAAASVYSNRFTCVPTSVVFRPSRTTPAPSIAGVQTALVVGPKGSKIHTDRYGRVKVQFHWDREGKPDGSSSCWIRVAHDYTRFGPTPAIIPRVGSEVVVAFLEGDPDRPLVIGRVHNAKAGVFVGDDTRSPTAR